MDNAQRALDDTDIRFANTPEECVRESDVVVVATPWKQFRELGADVVTREGEPRVVIDCWRVLPALASVATYIALGEGVVTHDLVRSAG
jgi:predicted dinucleotide-binding enzyme